MGKIKCKCGFILNEDDPCVKFSEIADSKELSSFFEDTTRGILNFMEHRDAGKLEDWVLKKYAGYKSALKFSEFSLISDLLTVNRPHKDVVECPQCLRIWIDRGEKMVCYQLEGNLE